MFYCVYTGNSKVSNTARDVHCGVKQASRVQNGQFHWLFTTVDYTALIFT